MGKEANVSKPTRGMIESVKKRIPFWHRLHKDQSNKVDPWVQKMINGMREDALNLGIGFEDRTGITPPGKTIVADESEFTIKSSD